MKRTGTAAKGHTSKHVGTSKHKATSKHAPKHHKKAVGGTAHHVHAKAKHPSHAKGLALGDALPVCTVEALAMSLRLAGQPVAEDEVAWVWELAGGRELTIAEALAAAVRLGLAGCAPRLERGVALLEPFHEAGNRVVSSDLVVDLTAASARASHALILGVDIPGPHAVLATPDGWWSWGQLWTPWTRSVDEAWVISWQ